MIERFGMQRLDSFSDNRKSKACPEFHRRIKNRKWLGIFAIVLTFILGGAVAQAQQSKKVPRIGFLDGTSASGTAVFVDAFRQELTKLGWIEGKSITIEYRYAEGKRDRLPDLAAELVGLKVDLIVVTTGPTAAVAKRATTTIPIVITTSVDPVGEGLVDSLARPGGNVTGLSAVAAELNTKRLEILKDTVPELVRVGLLRPTGGRTIVGTGATDLQLKELRPAALALKLKLEEIETPDNGFESAFQTAKQKRVNAITMTASRAFFAERKRIVELAAKHRLPAIYPQKEFIDEGGLMFYGADFEDLFRRSAHYVDKILKGTKPSDLPVQQATKFEFVINLKAAKQIGLTIPGRVLERANKVIR